MAISDVLSEAAEDIREYMRKIPLTYDPLKERIDSLLQDMDDIRIELDTPPKGDTTP